MAAFTVTRERGVRKQLLAELEIWAEGCFRIRLETGVRQPEAIALHRSAGFREIGPFGDYAPGPVSVLIEKQL